MDGLALASLTPCFPGDRIPVTVSAGRQLPFRPSKRLVVFVAAPGNGGEKGKDEEEGADKVRLDKWEQMELKFGQYLGEDPKLTMAKIMARKANPGVSLLDVEKQFKRNKGKMVKIEELPFDVPQRLKKLSSSADDPDLVRPVPWKGVQFENEDKPIPPSQKINEPAKPVTAAASASKHGVPDALLRKPPMYLEDRPKKPSSRVMISPTLILKTSKDQKSMENFSNITLLRKPEPSIIVAEEEQPALLDAKDESDFYAGVMVGSSDDCLTTGKVNDLGITLLKKPEALKNGLPNSMKGLPGHIAHNGRDEERKKEVEEKETRDNSISGMQPDTLGTVPLIDRDAPVDEQFDPALNDSASIISLETALLEKPRRLDPSAEEDSTSSKKSSVVGSSGSYYNHKDILSLSAIEDVDWTRAENLVKTGVMEEVELSSASLRGFTVLFGSLVGFLPYGNLTARWKFLAFESWLSQKGLDPSRYPENFHIIGSYDTVDKNALSNLNNGAGFDRQNPAEVTADVKLGDLQSIYDQEKLKFLSSSVGQSIRVHVVVADRKLKKLIVSLRPRERDEALEKKRNLMAKLQIGDVVKCYIKKITYCGIFVEIEGVTALIHQTEISWDATFNAVSYYKVGQMVEAKVVQLDFPLERIHLSLKETMPDPLTKTLDHLGGDRDPLDGVEAAKADAEWPEVDSLIEELQQIDGVQTVSKGRFSLSPALAPTFQVYMASTSDNQYKLLARAGNKVQEVVVQASLSKEEMASTILSCATRVK